MATSEIKTTFGYADGTTRNFALGPFDSDAAVLSAATTNILNFNDNIEDVGGALLSDGGGTCTGILAASIYTVNKIAYNLNDE